VLRGKRGSNKLHEPGSTMNEGKNPKEAGPRGLKVEARR